MQNLSFLTEIPETEQKDFDQFIQAARKEFISAPKETVKTVLAGNSALMHTLHKDHAVSAIIRTLREEAYRSFLVSEAAMNAYILRHISEKFAIPEQKFDHLYNIFQASSKDTNKAAQMANHNVIIVVYKEVKAQESLLNKRNIISFEDYFFDEIPDNLRYWQNNGL